METVLKAIADWIKGILTAGIMSNLSGLFDDVNAQVGNIAQQVGTKPSSFEPRVFAMIEALSRNVVLPIAGIILTFIACYELIEMITQHNNMAQFEPALIMRWIFKTAVSVWFISNTFDIVMAVFDITQKVVSDSSGIIAGNTRVNDIGLSMLEASLMQMDVGPLFGLFLQSFFIGITMRILSIIIFVIVYALKEGWDCPFAYILASLANRTSQVDVEQIVGRILRLPYTRKHPVPALNMSYVLTSSADFKHTLDGIVKGLNNAGFTDQDYRAQEEAPAPAPLPAAQQTTFNVTPPAPAEEPDIFDNPNTVRLDPVCVSPATEPQKIAPAVQDILAQAGKEIVAFEAALQQHKDDPASDLPQEAQKMVGQAKVKAEFADEIEQLVLPKFCLKIPQSILMPGDTQELTKENLLSNFTLKGKPSNIDFDHLDNNLAQVDLDGDGTPRASKMESQYQQFIGQQFPLMPGENRLKLCRNIIHTTLSRQKKLNAVDDTELQRYVDYIIDGMNQDQLDALEQMPVNFANKICDYIIKLQEETARENFYNWLEVGKIVTQPRFKLTSHITLSGKASSLTKSLYKQECELDDNFEYDMAMALTGIDSVRWWHRNPTSGRNAFCLNAFRNHYPDFIVMTNSGKVLLVETKGDQLENAESREKIKLGRAWQNAAGSQYRYYMVFQNKDLHLEGAYRFDEFLKILGKL